MSKAPFGFNHILDKFDEWNNALCEWNNALCEWNNALCGWNCAGCVCPERMFEKTWKTGLIGADDPLNIPSLTENIEYI